MTEQGKKKEPGEKFKEEAKPFVEEVQQMATQAYHKIISLGHNLGQTLQKTFAPTPGLGGGSSGGRRIPTQQSSNDDEETKDKE